MAELAEARGNGCVNWQELMDRVDGDQELLAEIVQLFVEDSPRALSEIQAAVARGDAQGLYTAAHRLKGAVANLAAANAYEAARALEMMGRNGELSGAQEAYAVLGVAVAELEATLSGLANQASV